MNYELYSAMLLRLLSVLHTNILLGNLDAQEQWVEAMIAVVRHVSSDNGLVGFVQERGCVACLGDILVTNGQLQQGIVWKNCEDLSWKTIPRGTMLTQFCLCAQTLNQGDSMAQLLIYDGEKEAFTWGE